MDTEFWIESWNQNKIGFHQREFNNHLINFWQQLNISTDSLVFVPLCGKSLDLIWLKQQGHSVHGIELRYVLRFNGWLLFRLCISQFSQPLYAQYARK